MTDLDQQCREVLRHYPRIYVACHVDHADRRGQGDGATARDQTLLVHIPEAGARPQELAAHLDVAASTMSEALKRLAELGLVTLDRDPDDGRGRIVRLTLAGREAAAATSVLDVGRVTAALAQLSEEERAVVVRGLGLLADSAQRLGKENP